MLTFLFIFISKNKTLKDYMFYIGLCAGLMACITPITAYGRSAASFDAIRFFVIHGIMALAPFLMVICGHHKLNWRRTWRPIFVLACVMGVILINEVILISVGIINPDNYEPLRNGILTSFELLVSNIYRNGAMVFGPENYSEGGMYGKIFAALCPNFLKTVAWGPNKGQLLFWPILWGIIPGFIYITIACFLICMPFDYKRFWRDMRYLWYTVTRQKSKRQKLPKKLSTIKH
jgi:hypothetical protein